MDVVLFKKSFCEKRSRILKNILALSDLHGDESVLDLGTGAGWLAVGFAKRLQCGGKVYGVDIYSLRSYNFVRRVVAMAKINFIGNTLKNARRNAEAERVADRCEFITADPARGLEFPDSFFDIILSGQFLYCLSPKERVKTFKEIDRLLKQDGRIIFFESKSFLSWSIEEVKKYFENIGYRVNIVPIEEYKQFCIFLGHKI
jgi:ubiquinone/menaquinone biosynthesis C-methylase UbiE